MPVDTDELQSDMTALGERYSELQKRLEQQAIDIRKAKKEVEELQETIRTPTNEDSSAGAT